jgi:hypothetical protein
VVGHSRRFLRCHAHSKPFDDSSEDSTRRLTALTDVICGPIDLFFSIHLPWLEKALSRDGVSVRVAHPPESSTLFLEASRRGRGVTVPPHLREQMMTELVTPDCVFAAIDEILKLNEANPSQAYDSRIVVFADEQQVWELENT